MIKAHEFNSAWWGREVGIVTDPAFFAQPASTRQEELSRYAWVELVQPPSKLPLRTVLAKAGFFYTDSQVRFRLRLERIKPRICAGAVAIQSAYTSPFEVRVDALQDFAHERFYQLPGVTSVRVAERYAQWSNLVLRDHPETCLQFLLNGKVQGWFLSHPASGGLRLALAMLSTESVMSGFDLYSAAIAEYAAQGFRLGFASFSLTNTAVHNIYTNLGARFVEPTECWLWLNRAS
jgi:hypothetical protein